ncbi:MAG: hypothetical protein ABI678_32750, partial [Kofleriaceae bacterium]
VALQDAGVEGDRILAVGAIGERAFADAGAQERAAVRSRFKLTGKLALVEVAGLGAEMTGQLALQLSLLDANEAITFLFDAAGDADAAAVLRRQVPTLGLRGKLFGVSADAPLLWRAADVIVAKPRAETVARVLLVGGKLVALIDDQPNQQKLATALEARKRAVSARGLLMLASALDSAFGGNLPHASDDGADHVADIVAAVAGDKRGVIDERRAAAYGATRDRVRAASAAATAAAATTAMPGELEDLGGGSDLPDSESIPDRGELERLRSEVARRVNEMSRSMAAARDAATELADKAKGAAARGAGDEDALVERKADAERARMHAMLAELAKLEAELKELERAIDKIKDIPPPPKSSPQPPPSSGPAPFSSASNKRMSIDDQLAQLKKSSGGVRPPGPGPAPKPGSNTSPPPQSGPTKSRTGGNVDDELAALKKKMQGAPPPPQKKK